MTNLENRVDPFCGRTTKENYELMNKGYVCVHMIEELAREVLTNNLPVTMRRLNTYFYGSEFRHLDAYELCAVSGYFPEWAFHKQHTDYVLDLTKIMDETQKWNDWFEKWVDANRKEIAQKAAQALNIDWKDIEQIEL